MILSRSHHFLFVHVPKTAGTTVSMNLSRFSTERDLHFDEPWDAANKEKKRAWGGISKHSTAAEIERAIGQAEFRSIYKFGIIRDPYTRAVSMYRFLKFNFRRWPNSDIMDSFRSFAEFVDSDLFESPGPDRLFEPQSLWLTGQDGQLIVDRVVRMEALETEMREVYAAIGLPVFETLKPQNVSSAFGPFPSLVRRFRAIDRLRSVLTKPHPINLNDAYAQRATQARVAGRYARDFEMFDYSSELPGG